MSLLRTNFYGDPNLGLYGFATDAFCLAGVEIKKNAKKTLHVPVHSCKIMNTELVGIFATGNRSGIILPKLEKHEMEKIEKIASTLVLKSRYTAFGNLIMINDKGAIISPFLRKHRKEIADFFKIECEVSTIAGLRVTGSLGIATNKGCLVHPKIRDKEKELIEKTLQVPVHIGTVNFGSPFVKCGIVANRFGVLASEQSTGYELGRITESLGFI